MGSLWVLLLFISTTYALVGYDCGGQSFNVTTFALNQIGTCQLPTKEPTPIAVRIQLLQIADYTTTEIIQCKVEIDRTIYYCGMNSHNSIVHNGRQAYLIELDKRACTRLQESGIIQLSISSQIVGIKRNSTSTRGVTLAGSINNEGRCTGTQYSDPYGNWDNVIVQATAKISISNYVGDINLKAGQIILRSGTHCQLADGSCTDIEGNTAHWETEPVDSCMFNRYDVLYEGPATKLTNSQSPTVNPNVYTLTTQETTFALATKAESHICGYTLIKTEHPKLFILETQQGQSFAARRRVSINNLDIFSYINSKFIYVEKHLHTQMNNLYLDVLTQRCNLEKQVLQNALTTANILPEQFARAVMKTPGYMAVIAGEVAHIIKCIPVECTLRRTTDCYNELPVLYRNTSFFLTPNTRTLIKMGTQTECNPLLPAQYLIEGTWYRFVPNPMAVPTPQILTPLDQPTWTYSSIGYLATSGIYTTNEIEDLRDRIMFPAEKPALLNNIARGSIGYAIPQGSISLKNFLDSETLDNLAESTAKRLWNGFEKFGIVSAGLFAILTIFSILKSIIDTCIHGYTLHSLYGWSFALVGAIWSSITHLLIARAQRANTDKSNDVINRTFNMEGNQRELVPEPAPRRFSTLDPDLAAQLNQTQSEA